MNLASLFVALLLSPLLILCQITPSPTNLPFPITHHAGFLAVPDVAFLSEARLNGTRLLVASRFGPNPFFSGAVDVAPLTASFPSVQSTTLDPSILWPNDISQTPSSVREASLTVPGGFLVPGKSTGAITFLSSGGVAEPIVAPKSGYFYHMVDWLDVDHDGLLDCITARVNKPIVGKSSPQWLWLKNPGSAGSGPWAENVLAQGNANPFGSAPEFFFAIERGPSGNTTGFAAAANFFAASVSLYFGGFLSGSSAPVGGFVLDDTIGSGYQAEFIDLDGDGANEILVTNHVNNNYGGVSGVYAYHCKPGADRTVKANWARATLASGFATLKKGRNQASLASLAPFFPNSATRAKGQPWLLLSGDGSGGAFVLFPTNVGGGAFEYGISVLEIWPDVTVGQSLVTDLEGSGGADLLIPLYEKGEIHRFSFQAD
jgi:hypothetical protein